MSNVQVTFGTRILTVTVSGVASRETIVSAIEEHYPRLGERSILWDFSHADVKALTALDLEAIAAVAKRILPHDVTRKTAYVVSDHDSYVRACKYLNTAFSISLPAEYRVFTSLRDAQNWVEAT